MFLEKPHSSDCSETRSWSFIEEELWSLHMMTMMMMRMVIVINIWFVFLFDFASRYVLKKIRLARQTDRCRRSAHQEVKKICVWQWVFPWAAQNAFIDNTIACFKKLAYGLEGLVQSKLCQWLFVCCCIHFSLFLVLVLLQSTIVWLMEKLSSGTKQITCLFHAAKMVLHWRSSVFLSMCVFSDVIGVPSEASLHSGVQGVLGGEGKLHMVLKQAIPLCTISSIQFEQGGVYGRSMSEWALILWASGFCSVWVKWFC